jgi:hypothetical protein
MGRVPDAVELPGGAGVRIYIVESPTKSFFLPGKVASYTAADGVNFVKDAGYRFSKDGFVDTEILRATTGKLADDYVGWPWLWKHTRAVHVRFN